MCCSHLAASSLIAAISKRCWNPHRRPAVTGSLWAAAARILAMVQRLVADKSANVAVIFVPNLVDVMVVCSAICSPPSSGALGPSSTALWRANTRFCTFPQRASNCLRGWPRNSSPRSAGRAGNSATTLRPVAIRLYLTLCYVTGPCECTSLRLESELSLTSQLAKRPVQSDSKLNRSMVSPFGEFIS